MSFFQEAEGEACVIVENGVYKQVPIYIRNNQLYAKFGTGYIRLLADGSTSKGRMRLEYMSWDGPLYRDRLGRLCTGSHTDAKKLESEKAVKLLGAPDAVRETP